MLRSFLAGAAIGALVDAWTLIPVPGSAALPREYLLLTVGGTLLSALVFAVAVCVGLLLPPFAKLRERVECHGAFLPGLLFGLMPILISFLPEALAMRVGGLPMGLSFVAWSIPAGALLLLAPPTPAASLLGARGKLHFVALAVVVFATLFTWTRPAAVQTDVVQAPAYPDPDLLAAKRAYLKRGATAAAADAPDLVVVSIDTLRTDLRRDDRAVLPILEELRGEAAWHAAGYSTSNQTVPGHIGMLAGLSPEQHIVGQNSEFVRVPNAQLMATQLYGAGYRTAGVVSNAMANYFWPGYESWDNSRATYGRRFFFMRSAGRTCWLARLLNPRRSQNLLASWLRVEDADLLPPGMSTYTTDSALRLHAEMAEAGGQPLHLFVHYMDPHSPYSPPESTAGAFSAGRALPKRYLPWEDDHRILINRVRNDFDAAAAGAGGHMEQAEQAASLMHAWYDEEILAMDGDLRRLLDALRESGRPTLLVITSDHGEHFGEHGLMEHSNSVYKELVQVPFLMLGLNGVDVPVGELPGPPSVIDIVPTMYSAAGLPYGSIGIDGLQGLDLLNETQRAQLADRPLKMAWSSRIAGDRIAVVQGARKLIALAEGGEFIDSELTITWLEAYQLDADPDELNNLVQDGAVPRGFEALAAEIEEAVGNWAGREFFQRETIQLSAAEEALLKELGYL